MSLNTLSPDTAVNDIRKERVGALLVFGSAFFWSFGGAIARFLDVTDSWTIVFWRNFFAAVFLIVFMVLRDGPRGTVALYRNMGWPGFVVAGTFATATTCFIIAISYTTVANVVLLQAGVPLFAALMSRLFFGERITTLTWSAIAAVIAGVAIMVSGSFTGSVSPIGDALALTIAIVFAATTVITRRYTNVRMTPAASLGALVACAVSATQAGTLLVPLDQLALLFVFGTFNLGLGMALFVTGARLIPSALAALLGTGEMMLAPVWVAVIHGEIPSERAIWGGLVILAALITYLGAEFRRQQADRH
ncbi:EamA domain-containing membrane protein RarD [Ciceribacter lividus]|uniref:EamA domain-containing membrane protein RarD n=1 Tax=Ciceribacter lividus TaxID=1197950 RepID=A0A6I7HPI9_9HYPH|nr:DMT family transporter [Ciceribacter lividus]RCW27108.1 EamA domain-containing membrane protein RarD [Ciceribacter lividus]